MKRNEALFVVSIAVALLVLKDVPLPAQVKLDAYGNINVRDYGAKGDGSTDDTEAVKAAFAAVGKRNMTARSAGVYYTVFPEVIFPAGRYLISDTIPISGSVVRGLGDAAIIQKNPEKDIFHSGWAWRMTITGLTFIEGRTQLDLGNPNVDSGMVIVEKCKFYNSKGAAVVMREKSNSTDFLVKDCVFVTCEQTLISHCDHTVLRDSWITTGRTMNNKASIENRGWFMNIENIIGVPMAMGIDQRWIDNYGAKLTVKAFRFGGEFGGFTAVVNYTGYSREAGGTWVILEDCYANCLGNNKRLCAVYLEEVPNQVVVRDCVLAGVPAVKVSPKLDLSTYFDGAKPGMLRFDISGNVGEFSEALPEEMMEAAKKRKPAPIEGQMNEAETREALAKAAAEVRAMKKEAAAPAESNGHRQKMRPADYAEFTPQNSNWDLEDFMDATRTRNSEYVAMAGAGDDVVFMRRVKGSWPHVIIRDLEIDLDETPWLTWKQRDTGKPAGFGVRAIHQESGNMVLLVETHSEGGFFNYYAFNLKEKFNLEGGVHKFSLKFYPLACQVHALSAEQKSIWSHLEPGEYQVLDFLRAEKE
jgi:hypothetical protein